jgi:hypothetical protein
MLRQKRIKLEHQVTRISGGRKSESQAIRKKENIEQRGATRCFPEGRKITLSVLLIGCKSPATLAANMPNLF